MQGRAWKEPNLPRASGSSSLCCRAMILSRLVLCTQRLKGNISNHFVSVIWGSFVRFQKIRTASRPLWVPGSGRGGAGVGRGPRGVEQEKAEVSHPPTRRLQGRLGEARRGTASGYLKPAGTDARTTPGRTFHPTGQANRLFDSFGTCHLGYYPHGKELPRDWNDHSDSQEGNSPSATEPGLGKGRRP